MGNDVVYRLGVIGDSAVVAAFKRIEAASDGSVRRLVAQFGTLRGALGGVSGLLGVLGITIGAGALLGMAHQAAETADSLGKMGQRLGTNAQSMAVLSIAAKLADVDIASSTRSLAKFITATEQAASGAGGGAQALKAVGFQARDIKDLLGKDLVERLAAVSERFAAMPDSARKSAAAFQLFGTRGAALIPLMNELGRFGFENLRQKAINMGAVFDQDIINSITQMNDHLKLLQVQINATSTSFVGSFAPSVIQSVSAVSVALRGSADDMKTAAQLIAFPFKLLLGVILDIGIVVTGLGKSFADLSEAVFQFFAIISSTGDVFKGAEALTTWSGKAFDTFNEMNARGAEMWKTLFTPPEDEKKKSLQDASDLDDLFSKQLEALRARLDGELTVIRAKTKLAEQAQQNAYDSALSSTKDYFNERRTIAQKSAAAEIAALEQIKAKEAGKGDHEGDIAASKTAAEITARRVELQTELLRITNDERAALRSVADEQIGLQTRLLELQGEQHAARMLAIGQEIRKADELLAKLGGQQGPTPSGEAVAAVQRRARLETLREALTLEADLAELQRGANRELDDYGRTRDSIQRLSDAGLISEAQAQSRIIALDRDRIDSLRDLAAAQLALAQATGDPEKIAAAQEFAASVDRIAVEMRAATDAAAALSVAGETAIAQGITAALDEAARSARNFGDYWRQVGLAVINTLNQMIAKFIQMRIVSALFPGASASLGGGSEVSGATFAASGGLLTGAGTGTSDSNLVAASHGEYIVKAASVAQPGVLAHLESINRYGLAALTGAFRRYADGGIVGEAPPSTSRHEVVVSVGAEPGLVVSQLRTPEGGDAVVRVVAERRRAIQRAIG